MLGYCLLTRLQEGRNQLCPRSIVFPAHSSVPGTWLIYSVDPGKWVDDIMKYPSLLVSCYFSLLLCPVFAVGHFIPKHLSQISPQSEVPGLCDGCFATQTVELLAVFFFFGGCLFIIVLWLLNNVVLLSAVQWSESAICIHIVTSLLSLPYLLPHITPLGHCRALSWAQCCTAGSH